MIDEIEVADPERFANQPRCFVKLLLVITSPGHRLRNTVSRDHDAWHLIESAECIAHAVATGLDERRVVVERAQFVHFRRIVAGFDLSGANVLTILSAAGIRAVCGGHKCERPLHSVAPHFVERGRKERMPVAVSPVDGEWDSVRIEIRTQSLDEIAALIVERTLSAEVIIMFSDFEKTFARNVFAARDILEKRKDIFRTFRPAERDNQQSVVHRSAFEAGNPVQLQHVG